MCISRRRLMQIAASAPALSMTSLVAQAQAYPARPVRILVGFTAGSAVDVYARLIAQSLSERLGQQFVVENRPGAGSNLAAEQVVRAAPDGYTLLLAVSANAINATLYDKLSFNFIRDTVPVGAITRDPNVIVVNPSVQAANLGEFIAYAKANPGKLTMASAGNGTPGHVAGQLLQIMTSTSMVHVPYRGGPPAFTDLLSGQVNSYFAPISAAVPHVKGGRLRALAVTSATRSDALPDVPAAAEFVPGFEASTWYGFAAPKDTPAEIVTTLNREINAALADPKTNAKLTELGSIPLPGSPADFGRLIAAETEKWGQVIRTAGIKAE
jgi:tripartite-type tricarboxylate transporter receptor subunit TctC